MVKSFATVLFILLLLSARSLAQKESGEKKWSLEAGPYVGITAWSFHITHSIGIGIDAKATKDFGSNFSGGGEISYGYFLGKTLFGTKAPNLNLVGIYANLQYTYLDEYVVGGDIGLGLGFLSGASTAAFARTGYVGYKFETNNHPLTLALYLNRTTPATYNIGIKSWYHF